MSTLRIKIGETWWTGEPGQAQSVYTSAKAVGLEQIAQMDMRSGPQWEAQQAWDLKQKGLRMTWRVTRTFADVAAMAAWLTDALSAGPEHEWQADAVLRWEHEDGEGYTESLAEWAALRIGSITHEGPRTLALSLSLMAGALEDYALRALPLLATEDGRPIVTEDGRPIVGESYQLVTA